MNGRTLHYIGLVAPGLVASLILPLVVPVWAALVLAAVIMLVVAALRDRISAHRRRHRFDDWSVAKLDASVERWRLMSHVTTWFAMVFCSGLAVLNIIWHQPWLAGFNVSLVAFNAWARHRSLIASVENERAREQYRRREPPPSDEKTRLITQDEAPIEDVLRDFVPAIHAATSLTLTAIVGRALAEGWTVDRIIETSNMPGDMVRFYAERAERGF